MWTVGELTIFTEEPLNKGGYGLIFRGEYEKRSVAVKLIDASADQKTIDTQLGIVKSAGIAHENIVRYVHYEMNDEFLHIAMELCVGTLQDLVLKELVVPSIDGTNDANKQQILCQITDGLRHLHSIGIVHCDLNPFNILVSSEGIMKLAGFGCCKRQQDSTDDDDGASDDGFTMTGFTGTSGWAAPEFYSSNNAIRFGYCVDTFSLGCVFGYTLTDGKHIFGNSDDPSRVTSNILKGALQKEIMHCIQDEDLRQLIAKMVSLRPECRPDLGFVQVKLLERLLVCQYDDTDLDENKRDELVMKTVDKLDKLLDTTECTLGAQAQTILQSTRITEK